MIVVIVITVIVIIIISIIFIVVIVTCPFWIKPQELKVASDLGLGNFLKKNLEKHDSSSVEQSHI